MHGAHSKLVARDIHKRYGDNEVLKGVSLDAKKGDVISIIGASGSGKSTFLRCINFLEKPNAGQIIVDGETVRTKASRGAIWKQPTPSNCSAFAPSWRWCFSTSIFGRT
jgi:histidine transport system ATP-binding protein